MTATARHISEVGWASPPVHFAGGGAPAPVTVKIVHTPFSPRQAAAAAFAGTLALRTAAMRRASGFGSANLTVCFTAGSLPVPPADSPYSNSLQLLQWLRSATVKDCLYVH